VTDTTAVRAARDGHSLRVFLVAGEASGDRLGAALIRALRDATSGRVAVAGIGGAEMACQGIVSPFPIDELAIMGFTAIPRRLPTILRHIREAADAVIAEQPDVLVIIDSPDFTHRVARRVRRHAPLIPIIDYVAPTVWAWRPWRARHMRAYVDQVLALLPFEPAAFERLSGPPCLYVGHPSVQAVAELRPNAQEAKRRASNPPILLVLPGSRPGEIHRMAKIFGDTVERVARRVGALELVLPTVPTLFELVQAEIRSWPLPPRIVIDPAEKLAAFRSARAALAKSGTVTLELALAGVPMVAAYKVPAIEALVARSLARVPSAILTNLVLGENVVPEFMQEVCTVENLAAALIPLLADTPERTRQVEAFGRLDAVMEIGRAQPAMRAAEAVLAAAGRRLPGRASEGPEKQ
jgi:lipid-A-disaccharide synthase